LKHEQDRPILITGALGFIGANLCRYFLAKGADVVAVEGPSGQGWRLPPRAEPPARFALVKIDLRRPAEIRHLIREIRPWAVINCAAYGAYSSQTDARRIYEVNFEAVRSLIEELRGLKGFRAFIQAGTSSEYGSNCKAPLETSRTLPDSEYAVSKVAATALVNFQGTKNRFPGWVLRLYSVYGPFEESSRLIPKLLRHVRQNELPPLVHPGISRDFVYVEDACRAFELLLQKADRLPPGEVFNIGTGRKTTLRGLVDEARKIFRVKAKPDWGSMPDRRWDHPDWYSNPRKAKKMLGWKAETSLKGGLISTLDWMGKNKELVDQSVRNSILKAGAS